MRALGGYEPVREHRVSQSVAGKNGGCRLEYRQPDTEIIRRYVTATGRLAREKNARVAACSPPRNLPSREHVGRSREARRSLIQRVAIQPNCFGFFFSQTQRVRVCMCVYVSSHARSRPSRERRPRTASGSASRLSYGSAYRGRSVTRVRRPRVVFYDA